MASAAPQKKTIEDWSRARGADLPRYLARQRWFAGKARAIQSAEIRDVAPFGLPGTAIFFARVRYLDGESEICALPLAICDESVCSDSDALLRGEDGLRFSDAMQGEAFTRAEDRAALLETHVLEKAICELGYELNNSPAWAGIPPRGIAGFLEG